MSENERKTMSDKPSLTIGQMKKEKEIVEGAITDLLNKFQTRTGLGIKGINMQVLSVFRLEDKPYMTVTGVKIEVQL